MKVTWDPFICFLGLLFWRKLLITSCFLSKEIFKQKVIHYILCQLYFFKHIFEQKFIALHLNESFLCSLLCFLSVLRYLSKACVFFCAKYLNEIMIIIIIIIINCPDYLNYYTTADILSIHLMHKCQANNDQFTR